MQTVRTRSLDLVPASLALLDADLLSPEALADEVGASVPASWPPGEYDRAAMEFFRARLLENPDAVGWYGWYAVQRPVAPAVAALVACGGYFGPPGADGIVEIGYSILPEFRGRGFATELVEALVARAFSVEEVVRVIAHTTPDNVGSVTVLQQNGFSLLGPGSKPGSVQYGTARTAT